MKEGKMRVVAGKVDKNDSTRRPKEKSAGAHLRKSTKWPGTGYEVADLTQEAQDRGKKEGKSTEAWSETGARRHKAGDKIAEETHGKIPHKKHRIRVQRRT